MVEPGEGKVLVVALDGPAGAGKSTVAKRVAEAAGLALVDTGAIYRSVALLANRRGISHDDDAALADIARTLPIRFRMVGGLNVVFLDDEDVSSAIRTPDISMGASAVSRHPAVRTALLELQRSFGRVAPGAVLEGRDIGTVVFPDARVKVFLTASPEVRARRRCLELDEKGTPEPYDKVLREIVERDHADRTRAVAPLVPAADATLVNTDGKSLDDVVSEILGIINRAR